MHKATFGLIAALLVLLVSCNEGNPDSQSAQLAQSTAPTAAAEPDASVTLADSSNSKAAAGQPEHLGYCVEYCASCGEHRGENTAPPRDEPVRINFDFMAVHYNDAPDADMSKLDFVLVGQWRNRERMKTHLSMDHREQDNFPIVDVGLCKLHVEPMLSEVVETAIRNRSGNDYKTYGAYMVTVTDPDGVLVGEFPLDGNGEAGEAQWQNTKESVYHVGKAYKRDSDEWRYDIRRMSEFREQEYEAPVLFGLVFRNEGKLSHSDVAPDHGTHEYVFPAAGVDIYTPEAIRAAGLAAIEREKAERDVKLTANAGELPKLEPAFIARGIGDGNKDPGNGYSPPVYGGGCGGGG
ncbi:MAG: hypothetical protein H7A35_05040 [Planctomycetales bacterium]|nr:hypothetical protein [bacterium]UNM09423.1 MAG: hypothetical protein H7A35_05040 [Planctomycetales bacterium]